MTRPQRILAARPKGRIKTPRLMGAVYSEILRASEAQGFAAAAPPRVAAQVAAAVAGAAPRPVWMTRRRKAYVIGAGLAGLSAATVLASRGAPVTLIEAAPQAGGRCRSYFDPALDGVIDNGNHLVLSGNHAVHAYLARIGAQDALAGPPRADSLSSICRTAALDRCGPMKAACPTGCSRRDAPGAGHQGRLIICTMRRCCGPTETARIGEVVADRGPLWERLMQPFLLAALNTEPEDASAALAGAVLRETLAKGGRAYRPRIAHPTLAAAFVDPALAYLKAKGAKVQLGTRLRGITLGPAQLPWRWTSPRRPCRWRRAMRWCWRCRPGWRKDLCPA